MKAFFWFAATVFIAYVAICLLLYWQQERLLFFPTKVPPDYRYPFPQPYTEVMLPVSGAALNVVHFTRSDPNGVILYLHGNGDIIARMEPLADFFLGLGYAVVIPDYRGYGKSTGAITSEQALHADMAAVYRYVQEHYAENQITIYGQSMGTGFAARLAAENRPARLILESPYDSVRAMAERQFPWLPRFLLKYQLRTDLLLPKVTCPVYLIHGTADPVIPYVASEILYALIPGEKELLTVTGGGHNLLLRDERVRAFLQKIL
ncbi:MAG: alpha/beta fold hydrolase [Caldilinea sp. CFX5]|nr:alpha/beta fold hydrolase [Caldilinea sp. CFX5]